jgi:hypothetical protein
MCGDCWNAAMGAPAAAVAARFAWVGYKDRIPFLNRRDGERTEATVDDATDAQTPEREADLVDAGAPPP